MRVSVKKIALALGVASMALLLSGCESGEETVAKLVREAEKGDAKAMAKIAEIYCGGINIEQDDQVCGVWMRRAAESGHSRSQYMLGTMYEQGLGMRTDYAQAYRWYKIAFEDSGYHMAGSAAEKLEGKMRPEQMVRAKAMIEESRAVKKATGRYFVYDKKN